MVQIDCAGYHLSSEFDSGNLNRVELVRRYTDELITATAGQDGEQPVNAEINVWTRPDCHGTQYENTNRTWFYFSIKGGRPSSILRINVMNLNRQAKLYSQGMHPVLKIGVNGKWERTKDKDRPSYHIDGENFVVSFLHRAGEDTSVEHFYAFTYPYTYRELQEYLNRLDRRFRKRMFDIQRRSVEENICLFVEQADLDGLNSSGGAGSSRSSISERGSAIDPNDAIDANAEATEDIYNEIYYYRELLTHSVEKRRIDLVTITSYHGISAEREDRLDGLFPELLRHRCHTFKNKKIVFVSSRVHPGETPASFVLNGFMRLLLDRKSIIAATLRRMYVFKIVPFLNPDGVVNGLYRSDTLGHNLNRVYSNPHPTRHPSIYAVQRLLRFYQYGFEKATSPSTTSEELPLVQIDSVADEDCNRSSETTQATTQVISLKELIMNQLNKEPKMGDDQRKVTSPQIDAEHGEEGELTPQENDENCTPLRLESLTDLPESSDSKSSECSARMPLSKVLTVSAEGKGGAAVPSEKKKKKVAAKRDGEKSSKGHQKSGSGPKKEFKSKSEETGSRVLSARYKTADMMKDKTMESIGNLSSGIDFHNLYNHFEMENMEKGAADEKTNLFLYIDLHGHASKKGVFMYGNHMAHPLQAVEAMLLPRLMSMNSYHFHFDACNFSERNMYHKGKRDGLSKEGSGRVAVFKSTGLIKAYTLECNYNTGKYVNVLPPRGKNKTTKAVNLIPPKYSPAIFEEVGAALGASILDLTNANPLSRLGNSEFRTLQGLRNALRLEVEKAFTKNQLLLKAAKGKLKRLRNVISFAKAGPSSAAAAAGVISTTTASGNAKEDILKENKMNFWGAPGGRTAGLAKSSSITGVVAAVAGRGQVEKQQQPRGKPIQSLKHGNSGGSGGSSTLYGKKERPTRKKGKPVLCDSKLFQEQTTSTSGVFPKKKDLTVPLLNLVPVKRMKAGSSGGASSSSGIDDFSAGPSSAASSADDCRTPATMLSCQSDEPGCSTGVACPIGKVIAKRPSCIPIFKRPAIATSSSVSYANPSTSKQSSLLPVATTATVPKISSTASRASVIGGGGGVGGGPSGMKKSSSESSGTGKLKNKRSLKPDAPTKRKKSRAKSSVWH